jgi:hypothetical protein
MIRFTRRHIAIGTLTLAFSALAVIAGVTTTPQPAQAQPNPLALQNQPPAACVCASPVPVFGGSDSPQIAHCQCGALNCAAATGTGGVVLQCSH